MSEKIITITRKEFRRVIRYIRRNYPPFSCLGFHPKMIHTERVVKNENGLLTRVYVQVFDGGTFCHVSLHLSVNNEDEKKAITVGGTNLNKEIFSLEEFIEIESMAEQLTQFTKSLNLWKH